LRIRAFGNPVFGVGHPLPSISIAPNDRGLLKSITLDHLFSGGGNPQKWHFVHSRAISSATFAWLFSKMCANQPKTHEFVS
jgi:hypothetical protein